MVAIIPARGGSKRIPRKNIKLFLGQPILAYSIKTALDSKLFDVVMVSTEDDEIEKIAKSFGAEIPFKRSNKNADDFSTTVDVLLEVLDSYSQLGKDFSFGCCIYPTAPFISPELLKKSYTKFIEKKHHTLFPVLPYSFPVQRALKLRNDKVKMFYPENINVRSQDLEIAYHDGGQFYWFDVEQLKMQKKLWTDNSGVIVLNENQAHDIDTMKDWEIAELKYKILHNGEGKNLF